MNEENQNKSKIFHILDRYGMWIIVFGLLAMLLVLKLILH
jgi:predicted negative regulator of RcsB-dependent stress response